MLYSSRSLPEAIYHKELMQLGAREAIDIRIALTRDWPEGWTGLRGRIDRTVLAESAWPPQTEPLIYVCGPSSFVEDVASELVESGHHANRIRTERFGPTGG